MGNLFAKKNSNTAKPAAVSEQDIAILQLKQLRDKIQQSQKRVDLQMSKDRDVAKRLLQEGKKERAFLLLKKKKRLEKSMIDMDNKLQMLEKMVADIEFSQIQLKLVEGLKTGNEALKHLNTLLAVEDIESILEETREASQKQKEISDLITGESFTEEDREDLEKELDHLLGVVGEKEIKLPEVPAEEVQVSQEENEEIAPQLATKEKVKRKKEAIPAT